MRRGRPVLILCTRPVFMHSNHYWNPWTYGTGQKLLHRHCVEEARELVRRTGDRDRAPDRVQGGQAQRSDGAPRTGGGLNS